MQVLALQPEAGVARDSVKLLIDFLVSELSRRPQFQVFALSDLEQLLRAAKEERNLECNQEADSCLAEVAGAMGAQWLIGGNVGLLGDRLLINLRLTDTLVQTGQGNGQYAKTKSQIVPWGVAGGIALGAAVGLGISTGVVW